MFIPLRDDNSRRGRYPYVVITLVCANAFVWYLQLTLGEAFTNGFSTVPYEITKGADLTHGISVAVGNQRVDIPHYPGPHPLFLTIFSAMFMHGSWMHIIGNMVYLWIFGDQIEDELGHLKFLCFYLFCGVTASIAHIAMDPSSKIPCLGASGAIAGVLGAYLVLHPQNRVTVLFFRQLLHLPAVFVLGMWFVLQIAGQFGSVAEGGGVAYAAHIGGFVAGVLAMAVVGRRARFL